MTTQSFFKEKNLHGKDTVKYSNGDIYIGKVISGQRQRKGKMFYADSNLFNPIKHLQHREGDVYEGRWKNNLRNGQGKYTWATGEVYEGKWKDDQKHGKGTYTYSNGDTYIGRFRDDKPHGYGTYIYTNGDSFVGNWINGKRNGKGSWISSKIVEGWFTILCPNGDKYFGQLKKNHRHGKGILTLHNGNIYDGEWKNNNFHGKGIVKYKNGDIYKSFWINCKPLGACIITKPDNTVSKFYIYPRRARGNRVVKARPIDEGDKCHICFEEMNTQYRNLIFCFNCGINYHSECIHELATFNSNNNRPMKCPICRKLFKGV